MKTPVQLVRVRPRSASAVAPGPPYGAVRRLLVVRDDHLGDLVLTLPALDRLRAAYPDASLGLLVRPALVPLASTFDPVDRVLATGNDLAETVSAIRGFAPDAAICISRRVGSARALRRAGVRRVTGTGRRFFSRLFDRRVDVSRRESPNHELEHALDLAARGGATPGPVRFPLTVPPDARERVAAWLSAHGVASDPVVIHPGTGGSCPAWPADRWRDLAVELRDAGLAPVVSRGPADRAALAPFAADGFPEFDLGLPELAALLERSRLAASNSTGPIHLAAALGRPALAIHAPWRSCGADRWGPWGERGRALVVGSPEGWSRRRRKRHAAALMRELGVAEVRRALESMLEERVLDPADSGCTL